MAKSVKRSWLRRMIQDGRVIARYGYFYDEIRGPVTGDADDWLPARLSESTGDFTPGFMNIPDWYFTGKTRAIRAPPDVGGFVILNVTPSLVIDFQIRGGK